MKKTLLLLTITFFSNFANAQSPSLTWVKQMGGFGGFITPRSTVVDASGNVLTTGVFKNTQDFDPGVGVSTLTSLNNPTTANNQNDIFISKVDANGNFVWAKQFGGIDLKEALSISTDAAGNVYTTGYFYGTVDFDPGVGVSNLTSIGYNDIFISKLDAAGNFVWVKQMGSAYSDNGYAIAVDSAGNIFTTGSFSDTCDFDPNAGVSNLTTIIEGIFISKLDTNGNFVWAKSMGGIAYNKGRIITLDTTGNVYVSGTFGGTTDFDPGVAVANLTSVGSISYPDIFILKLDINGNYIWAKQFSGSGFKTLTGLAIDASGNVFTAGMFEGTVDFDPNTGVNNLTIGLGNDGYISKLDASGNFVWAKQLEGNIRTIASLALDNTGNVYTTGSFYSQYAASVFSQTDFDPGIGVYNLSVTHRFGDDAYILKLDTTGSFVWVAQLGGLPSVVNGPDTKGYVITIDGSGNIYTTGIFVVSGTSTTNQVDFDPSSGASILIPSSTDMFVHKMAQAALGVLLNNFDSKMAIFPNPTTEIINLKLDIAIQKGRLRIINLNGQTIIEKQNLSGTDFNFDVSNLNLGIYLLQLTDGNAIFNSKMIKK